MHLKEAAAAFADRGVLETYVSTAGFGPSDVARVRRLPPRALTGRLAVELQRRMVSQEVARRATRVATGLEAGNVLLNRVARSNRLRFAALRPTRITFDRRVSRYLRPEVDVVLGYQGATTATFRRARELRVATVLDYPIAHYAITESLLEEEARLAPEYAPTLNLRRYPEWLRSRYEEEIALADRIIMVSLQHQRTFEEAGVDPARMFIVPWYVDCELFSPSTREEQGVFRVLFLGQITQRKGLSYLVEGFRRARLDDAELVLVGRPFGTVRPWMDIPGVRHVGALPRFQLPEVLRTCHVIALPSIVEGFPISVLEGMACGLPAIISENIGRDIVEDGVDGFVVPTRDPDAIAERLRMLHADQVRRRELGRAARAKAETFTLERYRESLCGGVDRMLEASAISPVPAAGRS